LLSSGLNEAGDGAFMAAAAAMRGAEVRPFVIAVVGLENIGAIAAQADPDGGGDIDLIGVTAMWAISCRSHCRDPAS